MTTVFAHPLGGVLSAYGMGLADQTDMRQKTVEQVLDAALMQTLAGELDELAGQAVGELRRQHVAEADISVQRRLHLKYQGTDTSLEVPFGTLEQARQDFEAAYRLRYSFLMPDRALVVETISVEATGGGERVDGASVAQTRDAALAPSRQVTCTAAAPGATCRSMCARRWRAATRSLARPSSPSPTRPRSSKPAGRPS